MPSRSLSEAFKSHPVHLTNKQLDFKSVRQLPDSYSWTDEYSSYPATAGSVSVIDLSAPNAAELIGNACRTWGVFQVRNHGVREKLVRDIEGLGTRLFSLPAQQKVKAARSPDGMSGYGVAPISSFFSKQMWSEGFTIIGSPLEHFRQLWPKDCLKHCEIIEEYEEEMRKLAGRLMWLILGSLGISKEDIKWADTNGELKETSAALQLNSYPACPDPDRAMGLAAHTDSTLITILHQSNISGLQVLREGTGWVTVPPIRGTLVVNVGDLLQILSNGLYRSVLHQAVVNRTRQRLSIAYLYGPSRNVPISPLSKLVGPSQPPLYRSVTWSEYLSIRAIHFNKALSSVRLCAPLNGSVDVNDHNSVQVG